MLADKTIMVQTKMSPPRTVLAAVVGILVLCLNQPEVGQAQQLILPIPPEEGGQWAALTDSNSASRSLKGPGYFGDYSMYPEQNQAYNSYLQSQSQSQARSMSMPVPYYSPPVALSPTQYLPTTNTGNWVSSARSLAPMQARQFNPVEAYLRDQVANSQHQKSTQGSKESSGRSLGDSLGNLPMTIETSLSPMMEFNNQRVPVAAYYKQVGAPPQSLWNWSRNNGFGLRSFM